MNETNDIRDIDAARTDTPPAFIANEALSQRLFRPEALFAWHDRPHPMPDIEQPATFERAIA